MLCQWIYKWIFLYPFENFCENFMPQHAAERMTYVLLDNKEVKKNLKKNPVLL